jgi:hypothetical protein
MEHKTQCKFTKQTRPCAIDNQNKTQNRVAPSLFEDELTRTCKSEQEKILNGVQGKVILVHNAIC